MVKSNYDKDGKPEFLSEGPNEESIFDKFFGKSPEMRLWGELHCTREIDWTKSDIAESSGMSRPSLYRIFQIFLDEEIIIPSRKVKGVQLYMLNKNHKDAMDIIHAMDSFMKSFIVEYQEREKLREKKYKRWKKEKQNGNK